MTLRCCAEVKELISSYLVVPVPRAWCLMLIVQMMTGEKKKNRGMYRPSKRGYGTIKHVVALPTPVLLTGLAWDMCSET